MAFRKPLIELNYSLFKLKTKDTFRLLLLPVTGTKSDRLNQRGTIRAASIFETTRRIRQRFVAKAMVAKPLPERVALLFSPQKINFPGLKKKKECPSRLLLRRIF